MPKYYSRGARSAVGRRSDNTTLESLSEVDELRDLSSDSIKFDNI